ncbi:MAG TPA: alpha/beta hydrolase [Candidatus Binataceae bacterium]|nr:alpha/beta hydrolase [Candidatus Binataceae bacterium]
MLTERERAIIKKWNDFSARPRDNIAAFRDDLDKFCGEMGLNNDLPVIGALHENVELRSRLYADIAVPKGSGPHPVVLFIHGGGWMAGSPRTHRKLGMQFAEQGYLTVNLDYRLAPENAFPAGFEDCLFAAKWMRENVQSWNGDLSRSAIAGDSAGANLAAAVLVEFGSTRSAPNFRAAALIYGVFDFADAIERTPNREAIEGMARGYLGAQYPAALKDPRVSPLRAIKPGTLPPSFIICGTADALLPESRSIAAVLKEADIPYELHEIEEMPHAFMMIDALSACREGHSLMFKFLKRHV